jgi:hypothetical protein
MLEIDIDELKSLKEKNSRLFTELLDTLASVEDQKKALWKEIYENAVLDRQNAYLCYVGAFNAMTVNGNGDYVMMGPIVKKFLEAMQKGTDQLIKLSEIIAEVQKAEAEISPEDIMNAIGG